MQTTSNDNISILVNSCDKYSDVWDIFFYLFFKYWEDCPWPIYLGSNFKQYQHPRVININVGKDISWADSTKKMLEKIPSGNILFFLDDFFIFWKVDTKKVKDIYETFIKLDANYLRLRNKPLSNVVVSQFPDIVELPKNMNYRLSLDIAFWKKNIFLELLKEGENPWQMEIEGSKRSAKYDKFYATKDWVIERRNGLEAGKWLRYNLELLKKEGLNIPEGHPVMTKYEDLIRKYKLIWYKSFLYKVFYSYIITKLRSIKYTILKNENINNNSGI